MSKEAAADLKFSFGYDSDGELPFTGTSMEEKTMMEEYNEESLSTSAPASELSSSPTNDDAFIFISQPEMKKMKVDQLRKELKKRGLSTSGNKAALIERIQKAMVDKVAVVQEQQQVMVDDVRVLVMIHSSHNFYGTEQPLRGVRFCANTAIAEQALLFKLSGSYAGGNIVEISNKAAQGFV